MTREHLIPASFEFVIDLRLFVQETIADRQGFPIFDSISEEC